MARMSGESRTWTCTIEAAGASKDVSIDSYVQAHARARSNFCFHYKSPQARDFAASIRTSSHMLARYPLRELLHRTEPAARLDLAIR
ncbi:hypothetical protein K466DRAFT_224424 [Polyporus arcularius HHB13444]|uniref:Uncharacterized protein n=1 Tax=Polyporus arcularius HHB13444 TaxID=1314778 RepID=A0A5C3P8G1_9APHY|nr:hypothetical protein K466DRAFT_224424 [Polyporus arcularius HHB13444]